MHSSQGVLSGALPRIAADILERLRTASPAVHCITNTVAQAFTANVLLAAGAVPSMTLTPAEIGNFVDSADALLVNLGTFDGERREATLIALDVVRHRGKPWVLDPVLIDRSPPRAGFAKSLLARRPSVVRLNAAEFKALGGTPDAASVSHFAGEAAIVIALSGAKDIISDGQRHVAVTNGHPLMAKVTAMGCAASALTAACLSIEPDAIRAAASALLILDIAGEIAGDAANGPGSFASGVIDALHNLDAVALEQRAKVS
ncbi:MAG: hydroxyethylthiazole kinase [Pseudolabrys sp.]|nr:hydroxyethylthiazole kinase [Pseudolabrys sp.]